MRIPAIGLYSSSEKKFCCSVCQALARAEATVCCWVDPVAVVLTGVEPLAAAPAVAAALEAADMSVSTPWERVLIASRIEPPLLMPSRDEMPLVALAVGSIMSSVEESVLPVLAVVPSREDSGLALPEFVTESVPSIMASRLPIPVAARLLGLAVAEEEVLAVPLALVAAAVLALLVALIAA